MLPNNSSISVSIALLSDKMTKEQIVYIKVEFNFGALRTRIQLESKVRQMHSSLAQKKIHPDLLCPIQ